MTKLQPPETQMLEGPGTVRWAVGAPEGPRSHTWSVIVERDHSVYIGLRNGMKDVKLSLHPSKWRMALTAEAAAMHIEEGTDRVFSRWSKPDEFRPGWRSGATIHVATSFLGPGYVEKRVKRGKVAWYPSPGARQLFQFNVLLAEPSAEPLTLNNSIGDVAQVVLPDGFGVWITAPLHDTPPDMEEEVRRIHELSSGPGMAWGDNEDGSPRLLDLSKHAEQVDLGKEKSPTKTGQGLPC